MASDIVLAGAAKGLVEKPTGMPQLDFSTYPNQWFWLIVTLIVLYLLLNKIALPRIAAVLSARQGAISRDIEQAEALKHKALEAEEIYKMALADARAEASRIIAEAKAEIQKEVDIASERAEVQISAKASESEGRIIEIRAGAVKSIEAVAKDTTGEIIKAIMPGVGDAKAVKAAVMARLKGQ